MHFTGLKSKKLNFKKAKQIQTYLNEEGLEILKYASNFGGEAPILKGIIRESQQKNFSLNVCKELTPVSEIFLRKIRNFIKEINSKKSIYAPAGLNWAWNI